MSTIIAVPASNISRIVGYAIKKGDFQTTSPNLPQRIAVLGEANTSNQSALSTSAQIITSAKEAGDLYGYGSPIYMMCRILFPVSGVGGVGSVPVYVYPQAEDVGASEAEHTITVTGAATKNVTHKVYVSGRDGVDGQSYSINIASGDDVTAVAGKIKDAINGVIASPVTADNTLGVVTATTKWKGLTADDVQYRIDTQGEDAGLSYAIAQTTNGLGTPDDISTSLGLFDENWNTIVVNPYGTAAFSALEAVNGIPDPVNPTGRYTGVVFKPFIAIWGSVESDAAALIAITDAASRKIEVTNALAPAPNSEAFPMEAAANMTVLFAGISQNTPNLDVSGRTYPDMPVPSDEIIGDMSSYNNRDLLVKAGCSTVKMNSSKYEVQDFVTTYHPDGEAIPQFRYPRNLMIDFNVKYGYRLLELINVLDHSIAESSQITDAEGVVKPKQWKAVLFGYADDLAKRNLIVEVSFMQDSITVSTSETNPDRFDTEFKYKRSPFARIAATVATAGFAFGIQ